MLKKSLALIFAALCLAATVGAQKAERAIKTTYLNRWQAVVTCKTGRVPVVKEASGSLIISCEGEQK